jgi:Holliday junction resolvasome RuvABC endonuclease subunit
MIIAGLDLASYKSGYFILDINSIKYKIDTIEARGNDPYERIRKINKEFKMLFDKYDPDIIIIEDTYLDSHRKKGNGRKRGNLNTLKVLEKVHGAVISATPELADIFYLNASEHKEVLTGFGGASKQSTIWAVQKKLGVGKITDDEADAVALVLTYLVKRRQWHILEAIKNKYET